jgi:hypothetical protein
MLWGRIGIVVKGEYPMDNPQDAKSVEYIWTSDPLNSEEPIQERAPLLVSFLGVVQEQPRYIKDVNLKVGAIIQMVTTPTQTRGYIARAANDYLLCEVDGQEESQEATLTFVGLHTTVEDADAWITEAGE